MNPEAETGNTRHVLVTGGAGFIGSHLVERLLRDGRRVVVIDDLSTGTSENLRAVAKHPGLRLIHSKVSTCPDLGELVAGSDFIHHLAAAVGVEMVVKSPIHTLETNLHETEVLLEIAAQVQVPVLVASTSEVYGKSTKEAFSEDDDLLIGPPHQSRWSYACSKLMDEFLALAYARERGLPVTIVRLFNTVGPRQTGRYGMVLPRFIAAARAGHPLKVYGDGQQSRCFCYVLDTVEALVRLQFRGCQTREPNRTGDARSPSDFGEIFNIGGTEETSIAALAGLVIATLNSSSTIEFVPYAQAYAPGFDDMRRRRPVVDRLARTIDFRPNTSLREIVRLTAQAG
jgi:UDP-glucose 4-epimerase